MSNKFKGVLMPKALILFILGDNLNFPINTIHLVNNIILQEIHYYFITQIISNIKKI